MQLHLRRVGVEAEQDQISSTSGSLYDDGHGEHEDDPQEDQGTSGSQFESDEPKSSHNAERSDDNDGGENDNSPSEDQGSFDLPESGHKSQPSGSESCGFDEQLLTIIRINAMALGIISILQHIFYLHHETVEFRGIILCRDIESLETCV